MILSVKDISNNFAYSKYGRLLENVLLLTNTNIKWFYFLSIRSL